VGFARIGVRGTLSVSRTVGVVRAATVGSLPGWNRPFWTTRGTKRHGAARRVSFPECSTMAGGGQARSGTAAGRGRPPDQRTPAWRAPAQTPASVIPAGSARAAQCRRPPDSDTDGSDADGSSAEAGFALIIGLACHGPPRTNRTVGVAGLKPGGRYPENPDSWSPRCPSSHRHRVRLHDLTGRIHESDKSPDGPALSYSTRE